MTRLHIEGLDARPTHFAATRRNLRLALACQIAAAVAAHVWLLVALITP